ncbi:MAG: IS91 family transposase [Terriglobales bacterium]
MGFPRPKHDTADIVRAHRPALEATHRLSRPQKRVLTAIARCRTAALGGHLEVCACGFERPAYNSCRNRHCPKCQALAQEKWITARAARILPVPHFHQVFTPPSELRPLAMRHPVEIYNALFRAVSELLLELGRTRLKAALGLTMVLHTWTRELRFHPHIHVLVTAGGLALDGTSFIHRGKYLFPVKVMGALLRGKMLDALRRLHRKGAFPELDQAAFDRLMASLAAHKSWVVYSKAPFRRSKHVLSYLGRYTHRVGIANSRLVEVGEDHVTFRTKGGKTATLHPVEFLHRFIQHVLPDGFHKIRHAGLYADAKPGGSLEKARALLPAARPARKVDFAPLEAPRHCPHCGGILQCIPLTSLPRAPPQTAA